MLCTLAVVDYLAESSISLTLGLIVFHKVVGLLHVRSVSVNLGRYHLFVECRVIDEEDSIIFVEIV
jgi:hypothetical protein